jgi:hypothetical protein
VQVQAVIPAPICDGVFGIARTIFLFLSASEIVSIFAPAMIDATSLIRARQRRQARPKRRRALRFDAQSDDRIFVSLTASTGFRCFRKREFRIFF